jgi:uncharacterized protein (TIGR02996 family)
MSQPVLARDETEATFLEALRASPEDDATRLVYADWLEARGELERADFLRTVCKLAAPKVNPKKAPQLEERLIKLSTTSEATWRALVSRPNIEACDLEFRFKCPKQWSALARTDAPNIRHCATCARDVHFCATIEEVREHAWASHCVAFDPALRGREARATYEREHPSNDPVIVELGELGPYAR